MDRTTFVYIVIPAVILVYCALFGGLGAWVASQKGRSGNEGAVLGVFFGIIGVVIEALLPARVID